MSNCRLCGCTFASERSLPAASPHVEVLGRTFFGVPRQGPLCAECLEAVRLAGSAVHETDGPGLCVLCRARVEGAWGSWLAPETPPSARELPDRT